MDGLFDQVVSSVVEGEDDVPEGLRTADALQASIEEFEDDHAELSKWAGNKFHDELEPQISIFRTGRFCLGQLAMSIQAYADEDRSVLWPDCDLATPPEPALVLHSVITNLCNHTSAIFSLLEEGYDLPAKVVLRAFAEGANAASAIVLDKSAYDAYISEPDDIDRFGDHWREEFRPSDVGQSVRRALLEEADWHDGLVDWIVQFKKESYSYLSNFSHMSYATQTAMSTATHGAMPSMAENVPSAIFGAYTESMEATLNHYIAHLLCMVTCVGSALADKHDWEKTTPSVVARFYRTQNIYGAAVLTAHDEIFGGKTDEDSG